MSPDCSNARHNARIARARDAAQPVDVRDRDLRYARLRLDLSRLARRLVGPSRADALVQEVFLYVARHGPAAPRDAWGFPRSAYLVAILQALVGGGGGDVEAELASGVVVSPGVLGAAQVGAAQGG